ncbi:MAG: NADH:flavin oxidoreductase [Verrucomicrobiae bacterium]|nr:NADH:flavin oxidoreductase [Verrucomicrobiae bacterium]
MNYPRMSGLKTAADLQQRLGTFGLQLSVRNPGPAPHLASGLPSGPGCPRPIGNRFAILPMEGWDATADGQPTELVRRRWERFGLSGAKLIWGGEAVAVRHDGRANPRQLVLHPENVGALANLREILVAAHTREDQADDLLIGLQLTHSGRWSRPNDSRRPEPRIAYRHPLLDARVQISDDRAVFTDGEVSDLVGDFVAAAGRAREAGFHFVDIKHCHGYLGHEFLSAVERPGRYGGSLENRTRFLREIVEGIRRDVPGLEVGVRLSLFDQRPFVKGPDGAGVPAPWSGPYPYAFGGDPAEASRIAWEEPLAFLRMLLSLGIRLVCLTAASPYYNPHLQRPAAVPPSDGYEPPEDPLAGVVRQIVAVARVKQECPGLIVVGSAYSYLQEWLAPVGEALVAAGAVDCIGLGRTVLSYPDLPRDVLSGRPLQRRRICRTFSDCTTAPRNGLVSGCYPLDDFYKSHPDAHALKAVSATPRPPS